MDGTRHALVTGATGAVGHGLVEHLLAAQWPVRILVRTPPPRDSFTGSVAGQVGDINDPGAVRAALRGIDTVYHLAAQLHINNPGPQLRDQYERVNVAGTRLLLDEARAAGVRRFVFFSTINVYGTAAPGQVFDEDSP